MCGLHPTRNGLVDYNNWMGSLPHINWLYPIYHTTRRPTITTSLPYTKDYYLPHSIYLVPHPTSLPDITTYLIHCSFNLVHTVKQKINK